MPAFPAIRRRLLALVALVAATMVGPAGVHAQTHEPRVDRYTVDQGLAQNQLTAVAQDGAGFIWVGGIRGLQRFDGYSFERYGSLDPHAPAELAGLIGNLCPTRSGDLLVEASQRLFASDRQTHRLALVPAQSPVTAWAVDSAQGVRDRVWIVDGGRLEWFEAAASPMRLHAVDSGAVWTRVRVLATGRDGALWFTLAGQQRVVRYVIATRGLTNYSLAEVAAFPRQLLEDRDGRVWLATDSGLAVLDAGAAAFTGVAGIRGEPFIRLSPQGSGVIVATDSGIARVDGRGRIVERWQPPEVFGGGFMVRDMAVDREGGFWIATLTAGLFRLDPRGQPFQYASSRSSPPLPLGNDFVTALAERRDGSLWIGTLHGGAYRVSADGHQMEVFRHDPHIAGSLPSDVVWDFEEDRGGNLWVATDHGVCRLTGVTFRCLSSGAVDLARDDDGSLWAASGQSEVTRVDPETWTWGPQLTVRSRAIAVQVDPQSHVLWIAGDLLFRVPLVHGSPAGSPELVPAVSGNGSVLYDIVRGREGGLWLASDAGLQRWDSTRRSFRPVAIPELHNATVFSLREDDEGSLWLGSSHGLVRYTPRTGIVQRYGREAGVLSGEFNRRAALLRHNGEMLFGGVEGLTRFRPEAVTGPIRSPALVFTRWMKVTDRGINEVALADHTALRLDPTDHTFSVSFAALTFASSAARHYRYRLEGLSDEWIETNDHQVTYAAPPPGHYVLRVQAATGREGAWSPLGATLSLDVIPPFWKTLWFKLAVATLGLALLFLLHRLSLGRALATERVRLQISRDLHDEIGAALSTIALLSDAGSSNGGLAGGYPVQFRRIGTAARAMVADLRDIVWAIDPDADRFEDVVSRMRDVAADLLRGTRLVFHAAGTSGLSERIGMSARRDLLLAFKELLHNVARHAQASEVQVDVVADGPLVEVTVTDNGVGFDAAPDARGTGLKSVRERAQRLGGTFVLESHPGAGTTAKLTLQRTRTRQVRRAPLS